MAFGNGFFVQMHAMRRIFRRWARSSPYLWALLLLSLVAAVTYYFGYLLRDDEAANQHLRLGSTNNIHPQESENSTSSRFKFKAFFSTEEDDDTVENKLPVRTKLFSRYKPENIIVLSAMTDDYSTMFGEYIRKNRIYCTRFGYNYTLVISSPKQLNYHPTGLKIYTVVDAVSELLSKSDNANSNSWLVYLDADSFVAEDRIPISVIIETSNKFRAALLTDERRHQQQGLVDDGCHLIAQDQNHLVNSGVYFIRVSHWSLMFLQYWKAQFEEAQHQWGLQLWVYDQGALMNTLLHFAANYSHQHYNDSCVDRGHHANICFHNMLTKFGFPYKQRIFDNICLIPPIGIPYSYHQHNAYSRGEFIRHTKQLSGSTNSSSFLSTDQINQAGSFYVDSNYVLKIANGTFIRFVNPKALNPYIESIYIMLEDDCLHHIPDWETYLSLGGKDIYNAALVCSEVFHSYREGIPIPTVTAGI